MTPGTTPRLVRTIDEIRGRRQATVLLGVIAALLIWWAWKQGAYFGSVFYPGSLLVFLLLGLLLVWGRFEVRLSGSSAIAFGALVVLSAWTLLSALWSPTPSAAVADACHCFFYAAFFLLGILATNLLRARMVLALAPLAIAGAVVGIATVVVLATGTDVSWYLHEDATLRFPVGYRNANAAFWLICLWPLLALVAESDWRWEWRALLAGAGTLLVELAFLAQSRGSVPAVAVAALVFVGLSRNRLRAAVAIGLVVGPSLLALPTLLDVYQHGSADAGVVPLLRDAAKAISLSTAFSLAVSAVAFGVVAPRLQLSPQTTSRIGGALAIVTALVAVVGSSLFVTRHGGPVDFADQRLEEFTRIGYPDLSGQGIRYGANVGSNRGDFWRVSIREGLDHPLFGGGAGSFEVSYLERRRSEETPEDPHSVEALMISELGLPGLLLFATFVVASVAGGLRSRRLGPVAAVLVAGAVAAGTQWWVQASFDWLWNYPGVTAPALYLLGVAAAPALLDPRAGWSRRIKATGVVGFLVLALIAVPLYLAGRYMQRANEIAQTNPQAAITDLNRTADLNPLEAEPLLAKGVIESRLGERDSALAAFRQALDREPRNYAAYYLIARELVYSNPQAARQALQRASDLNPSDRSVAALERLLRDDSS